MSQFKFDAWPTEFRSITQPFGVNEDFYGRFGLPGHEGIDFMGHEGSKIFSVAPGRVIAVQRTEGDKRLNPYGLHVTVEHAEQYVTIYAHLARIDIRQGQQVAAGTTLGLSGNTGNSFGAHLHFTLKKLNTTQPPWPSNIIDPTPFVLPMLGFQEPAGPFTEGWAYSTAITVFGDLAQANAGGISLRKGPTQNDERITIVPEGSMMRLNGAARGEYTPVKAPNAAIGKSTVVRKPQPVPDLPPTVSAIDGWGYAPYLTRSGDRAVVGEYGINLRTAASKAAANIGIVKGGTTVKVMGELRGDYLPVRAGRSDFLGAINLPEAAPDFSIGASFAAAGDTFVGWAWTDGVDIMGLQAVAKQYGVNLRAKPDRDGTVIGIVKGFAAVTIAGAERGEYTPVAAKFEDMLQIDNEEVEIEEPGRPKVPPKETVAKPAQKTMPGWAFTGGITIHGDTATIDQFGINMRSEPNRNGQNKGFVAGGVDVIVTGAGTGEYTPIRVPEAKVEPAAAVSAATTSTAPPSISGTTAPAAPPRQQTRPLIGGARIGLHAAADPDITDGEHAEFKAMRPGIIKVMSLHSGEDIARLARENGQATWIVRAFLDFGGRDISPEQFVRDTIGDVKRSLDQLRGRDLVVELHNEPNLVIEGLGSSWSDGVTFNSWWLDVLARYRRELPGVRYIFPGLSPGGGIDRVRHDHVGFIEACRPAIDAADGLGTHIYWSAAYSMETALGVLDDYIRRFHGRPVWVTEASNNKGGPNPAQKAQEYLRFWRELQRRPTVQGVTYFIASSRFDFPDEVWIKEGQSLGIGRIIGAR